MHRRVCCLHSPASFCYSAAMQQAFPCQFALQLKSAKLRWSSRQTHVIKPSVMLPGRWSGYGDQLWLWQVTKSAQVYLVVPACWSPGDCCGCSPAPGLLEPMGPLGRQLLPQAGLQWKSPTASAPLKGTKPRKLSIKMLQFGKESTTRKDERGSLEFWQLRQDSWLIPSLKAV